MLEHWLDHENVVFYLTLILCPLFHVIWFVGVTEDRKLALNFSQYIFVVQPVRDNPVAQNPNFDPGPPFLVFRNFENKINFSQVFPLQRYLQSCFAVAHERSVRESVRQDSWCAEDLAAGCCSSRPGHLRSPDDERESGNRG